MGKEKEKLNDPVTPQTEEEPGKETTQAETDGQENTSPETEKKDGETSEKLKALEAEKADLSDRLLRKIAEFDNFKKRTTREKEEIGSVAKAKTITDILPVVDNFERALSAECADPEFKKGMEMIFKALVESLSKMGVEEIKAEGEPFSPDFHYAVSTVEDGEKGDNVVAAVLQKGYKMGDRVLRHAMVCVANP